MHRGINCLDSYHHSEFSDAKYTIKHSIFNSFLSSINVLI